VDIAIDEHNDATRVLLHQPGFRTSEERDDFAGDGHAYWTNSTSLLIGVLTSKRWCRPRAVRRARACKQSSQRRGQPIVYRLHKDESSQTQPILRTWEKELMKFVVATYGKESDARPLAPLCRGLGVRTTALAGDIRGILARDGAMLG
jgi:hypothetical protein